MLHAIILKLVAISSMMLKEFTFFVDQLIKTLSIVWKMRASTSFISFFVHYHLAHGIMRNSCLHHHVWQNPWFQGCCISSPLQCTWHFFMRHDHVDEPTAWWFLRMWVFSWDMITLKSPKRDDFYVCGPVRWLDVQELASWWFRSPMVDIHDKSFQSIFSRCLVLLLRPSIP